VSIDIELLRSEFHRDYATYKDLADRVREDLKKALRSRGIFASCEGRPKDEGSFIRKAIRKSAGSDESFDSLTDITDRAGVRAIVSLREEAEQARVLIGSEFLVREFQDTRNRLAADQLGYLGLHFLVELHPDRCTRDQQHLRGRVCEIQIHTYAQHAWSSVSHPLLYKPVGGVTSDEIARRVNRSVALIDIFDDEIEAARKVVMTDPAYRPAAMLNTLETEFLTITPRDFDPGLSLAILEVVKQAYDTDELNSFSSLIEVFVHGIRESLEILFEQYKLDEAAHPLLFQPEVIAIFERLRNSPARLRAAWMNDGKFGKELLDSLSAVLGI